MILCKVVESGEGCTHGYRLVISLLEVATRLYIHKYEMVVRLWCMGGDKVIQVCMSMYNMVVECDYKAACTGLHILIMLLD